jgi:hypothetical protein
VFICVQVDKTLANKWFLEGWTATVSKTVSQVADLNTTCHYWLKLAETLPPLAF